MVEVSDKHAWPFPFLNAAKFLHNFPPQKGDDVVRDAIEYLDANMTDNTPEVTFLGMCSVAPPRIVDEDAQRPRWTYSSEFWLKGSYIGGKTKIAYGEEDHFHRASIDVVFEWFKESWKAKYETDVGGISPIGTFMSLGVRQFFNAMAEPGRLRSMVNLESSYLTAMNTAASWTQAMYDATQSA